jgi:hypothetical protein
LRFDILLNDGGPIIDIVPDERRSGNQKHDEAQSPLIDWDHMNSARQKDGEVLPWKTSPLSRRRRG